MGLTHNVESLIEKHNALVHLIILETLQWNVKSVEVMNVYGIRVEKTQDAGTFLEDLNVVVLQDVLEILTAAASVKGN